MERADRALCGEAYWNGIRCVFNPARSGEGLGPDESMLFLLNFGKCNSKFLEYS